MTTCDTVTVTGSYSATITSEDAGGGLDGTVSANFHEHDHQTQTVPGCSDQGISDEDWIGSYSGPDQDSAGITQDGSNYDFESIGAFVPVTSTSTSPESVGSPPTSPCFGPEQTITDPGVVLVGAEDIPNAASYTPGQTMFSGSGQGTDELGESSGALPLSVFAVTSTVTWNISIGSSCQTPAIQLPSTLDGHSRTPIALQAAVTPPTSQVNWTAKTVPTNSTVTFADPTSAGTTATFSQAGNYVLELDATNCQLSASATVHVSITDTYTLFLKSWIPQPNVVDPLLPGTVRYRFSQLVGAVPVLNDPNCWTPPRGDGSVVNVTSTYHGDNHGGFDGSYRESAMATFTWDGTSISDLTVSGGPGLTIRNKVYTDAVTGQTLSSCSATGLASDVPTATQPDSTTFEITYTGHNPLTPPAITPGFVNDVVGSLQSDGTIDFSNTTTLFPIAGLQVGVNGTLVATDIENDVSCLIPSAVLGPPGALRLATGLTNRDENTATVDPGTTDQTFDQASRLC